MKRIVFVLLLVVIPMVAIAEEEKQQQKIPTIQELQLEQQKANDMLRQIQTEYQNMLLSDTTYQNLMVQINIRAGMIHERKRMLNIKGVQKAFDKHLKKAEKAGEKK